MKKNFDFLKRSFRLSLVLMMLSLLSAEAQKIDETAKLLPSDGEAEAFFGNAVATNGEIAVVGAWFADDMAGAAYVFRRTGDDWAEEDKLVPNDASGYDFFGCSVAVNGDYVIVGASGVNNKGAAYIFHYNGSNWTQTAKLTAGIGNLYDSFGSSVSLSDDYAIIGAEGAQTLKGAAYVFAKSGNSWQEEEMLSGTLYSTSFGSAVDISGETIIVGASGGSYAYVFMLDGGTWVNVAELEDVNGSIYDKFGETVSIDGDLVVVGATHHQNGSGATGAAYIYHRQGSNWVEEEKIVADDGELDDHFGVVSIYGSTVVIGAYDDDDYGLDAGSAYVYRKNGDNWQFKEKLLASDGFAGDELGSAVAVFSDVIIVGAPGDNDNGTSSGSAYVFPNNFQTGNTISDSEPLHIFNYPNPFREKTTVSFSLQEPGFVNVSVYNSLNQIVRLLFNGSMEAGDHKIHWDGTDNNGNCVLPGSYYYQMKTGKHSYYKKLIKIN